MSARRRATYLVYHADPIWTPYLGLEEPANYELVAKVKAHSPTEVFRLTNDTGWERGWWEHPAVIWTLGPARSNSVGDFFVEEATRLVIRVASFGFEYLAGG